MNLHEINRACEQSETRTLSADSSRKSDQWERAARLERIVARIDGFDHELDRLAARLDREDRRARPFGDGVSDRERFARWPYNWRVYR